MPQVVVVPVKRGSKKYEALRKLIEVSRSNSRMTWRGMLDVLIRMGISSSYAEKVVRELIALGVVRKVDNTSYEVDAKALEEALK